MGICLITLDRIEEGEAALEIAIDAATSPEELKRIEKNVSMTLKKKKVKEKL